MSHYHCSQECIFGLFAKHVVHSRQGSASTVYALCRECASPVENINPSILPGLVVKDVVEKLVLVVPEDSHLIFWRISCGDQLGR